MPREVPIHTLPISTSFSREDKLLLNDDSGQAAVTSVDSLGQQVLQNGVNFRLIEGEYLQLRDFTKEINEPGSWRGLEVYNGSLAATASAAEFIGTDKDTITYVNLSNSTDIRGIDAFIKGAKNLGLWDQMICWPLRQGQNIGSGTTVYSFGGLSGAGGVNGTLQSAVGMTLPAWSPDGLIFEGGSKIGSTVGPQNWMRTQSFSFTTSGTFFAAINFDLNNFVWSDPSANLVIMAASPAAGGAVYEFARRIAFMRQTYVPPATPTTGRYGITTSIFFGPGQIVSFPGPIANNDNNQWAVAGMSYASGNQQYSRNGGNFEVGNLIPSPTYPIISENYIMLISTIQRSEVAGLKGTGAAYFWFNRHLTQQEHSDFYNLYKNTLGLGLGLP